MMYTKKNTRVSFKSHRRPGFKRNNNFSNNNKTRNKGNVGQLYNKYLKLAKESFTSGDRIQSEYYYQFTDHYYRLMVELGINIEENQLHYENKSSTSIDNQVTETLEQVKNTDQVKDSLTTKDEANSDNEKNEENKNLDSIESIPFIAEPAKKKRARNTK